MDFVNIWRFVSNPNEITEPIRLNLIQSINQHAIVITFISYSRYSQEDSKTPSVWLSIYKHDEIKSQPHSHSTATRDIN